MTRRLYGYQPWRATVDIKTVMRHHETETTESIRAMMAEMATLLESSRYFNDFDREYLEEMKDLPDEPYDVLVETVDNLLDEIYDYGDTERIWLGA